MATFVHEHVNQLNNALSTVFQDCAELHQNGNVSMTSEGDQKKVSLLLASQAIDLSRKNALPDLEMIKRYLDQYLNESDMPRESAMEWLFVTKCMVAIYGVLVDTVLNSTLPLSESVQYWNDIYGSSFNEAYYALATAPSRIITLVANTIHAMQETQMGLAPLLRSPEHILTSLFPQRSDMRQDSIAHIKPVKNGRMHRVFDLFSSHRPWIAQLIHQEVGLKKKTLDQLRTQQATRLGLLIKMGPQFQDNDVSHQVRKCVRLMELVVGPFAKGSHVVPEDIHVDVQATIDALNAPIATTDDTTINDPKHVAKQLVALLEHLDVCGTHMHQVYAQYQPPSTLVRYWIPCLVTFVAGQMTIRYVFNRKEAIIAWCQELGTTLKDFAINWIWEPVLRVWDTIRLKDERLGVLSKEGLRSDVDSLERMVLAFARDHYQLSPNDAEQLMTKVRDGDLSVVLKAYEKEIKNPIKNAIAGDLIQTLLIQVQKTKVDVDLAMAALDKLLKSNELNFAFLAVAPSMLLTWASFSWIKSLFQRRTSQVGKAGEPIRETMRRVERLFDLALTEKYGKDQLGCESQGILLCEVHLLRIYAFQLPRRRSIRDHFMEDLRDLEDARLSVAQKLGVITRMHRSWDFLQPRYALQGQK